QNYSKSARAALGVPRLPSFDQRSYVSDDAAEEPAQTAPGLAGSGTSYGQSVGASISVTPDDLARFLKRPCSVFLKHAGVATLRDEQEPDDTEPFELDFLQGGSLKGDLLWLSDDEAHSELDRCEASGLTPGGVFWEWQKRSIEDFRQEARKAFHDAAESAKVSLEDPEERMFDSSQSGTIGFNSSDLGLEGADAASFHGVVASLAGTARRVDAVVNPYSKELPIQKAMCRAIAQALAFDDGSHCLWLSGSDAQVVRFRPFTRQEALMALSDCLRYYARGLVRPLPLWDELFKNDKRDVLGRFLGLIPPSGRKGRPESFSAPDFGHDADAAFLFGDASVCSMAKDGTKGPGFDLMASFYKEVLFEHAVKRLEGK
ncbi:MAG: hypothetical protein ACI4NA_06380, partial [Succinivibrio sp.]